MPLPDRLRYFNRDVANRVLGLLGGRVRPFATVVHTGRRSGREHRTTVFAFERGRTVAIALTYGTGVDWVRNLLASGRGRIELGGEAVDVALPRIVGDEHGRPLMPPVVRAGLTLIGVHDFLLVDRI